MRHTVTMDSRFKIQLPTALLKKFPPGTKVSMTLKGKTIRLAKLDAQDQAEPHSAVVSG